MSARPREHRTARAAWLIGPICLLATVAGMLLVLRGVDRAFGLAFGTFVALTLAWVLVSALFPAVPDKTCPDCGEDTLGRLDARTTHGLVCSGCGWRDETASSFLLAEEEGSLEPIVLRERRSRSGA